MDSRISLTKQFIKDLLNETRRDSVSPARLAGIYQRIIDIVDDDAASREQVLADARLAAQQALSSMNGAAQSQADALISKQQAGAYSELAIQAADQSVSAADDAYSYAKDAEDSAGMAAEAVDEAKYFAAAAKVAAAEAGAIPVVEVIPISGSDRYAIDEQQVSELYAYFNPESSVRQSGLVNIVLVKINRVNGRNIKIPLFRGPVLFSFSFDDDQLNSEAVSADFFPLHNGIYTKSNLRIGFDVDGCLQACTVEFSDVEIPDTSQVDNMLDELRVLHQIHVDDAECVWTDILDRLNNVEGDIVMLGRQREVFNLYVPYSAYTLKNETLFLEFDEPDEIERIFDLMGHDENCDAVLKLYICSKKDGTDPTALVYNGPVTFCRESATKLVVDHLSICLNQAAFDIHLQFLQTAEGEYTGKIRGCFANQPVMLVSSKYRFVSLAQALDTIVWDIAFPGMIITFYNATANSWQGWQFRLYPDGTYPDAANMTYTDPDSWVQIW